MTSELPTPVEVLQEYFGETDFYEKIHDIWMAREDEGHLIYDGVSDRTCDASLFPYEAEGPLETPIPTPAEIHAAIGQPEGYFHMGRVGPYMVKICGSIEVYQEAENLLYLERVNSNVRVPKVYAAFSSRAAPRNVSDEAEEDEFLYYYLVMEHIDGIRVTALDVIALDVTPLDELEIDYLIVEKIGDLYGEQLRRLRSIPAEDPELFGRINGKAYPFYNDATRHPAAPDYFSNLGPFNYETLVGRMIHTMKIDEALNSLTCNDFKPKDRGLLRDARSALIDNVRPSDRLPVLTHMHRGGVVVKLVRDEQGKAIDVEEVVLVDWSMMSWMPAWYEPGLSCYYQQLNWKIGAKIGCRTFDKMMPVCMGPTVYWAVCLTELATCL
jgi:hypothetical protein